MALIDAFGRAIRYLRLSVTDRCNFRCTYCRPEGHLPPAPREALLTLAELTRLAAIFAGLGIDRIRLTGGEPLLRRDVVRLVAELAALPGIDELSLSSNALLLPRLAHPLARAGLKRVNISLDTLDPATFSRITRGGALDTVIAGIEAALAAGLHPVKVNMVVMGGINDHEIPAMVRFARERDLMLRFIEAMPVTDAGGLRVAGTGYVPAAEILARVEEAFGHALEPVTGQRGNGPARYFRLAGSHAEVGVIAARSQHFCAGCNRVRLTSRGELVLCLGQSDRVDLKAALRGGADDATLAALVREAITHKPLRHAFDHAEAPRPIPLQMTALGG